MLSRSDISDEGDLAFVKFTTLAVGLITVSADHFDIGNPCEPQRAPEPTQDDNERKVN